MSYSLLRETMETIRETFSLLGDWEERYRYVIDLGRGLAPFPEALRTEDHRIQGCTSRVWMVPEKDAAGRYHFLADSDAHIVRGLIVILLAGVEGKTASEITAFDLLGVFRDLGLEEHLSPNRRNGFYAMAKKIREIASADLLPEKAGQSNKSDTGDAAQRTKR